MTRMDDLARIMVDNAAKAAQLYAMGEYAEGDYFAHVAERASDEMLRCEPVNQ